MILDFIPSTNKQDELVPNEQKKNSEQITSQLKSNDITTINFIESSQKFRFYYMANYTRAQAIVLYNMAYTKDYVRSL